MPPAPATEPDLAASVLTGAAAWPSDGGEPVFDEPWQGRAFAVAVELVASLGVPWDEFRAELIAAIEADPHRPYYESWVIATERLAARHAAVDPSDLVRHRGAAASYRYEEEGTGDIEVFPITADEETLRALLTMALTRWWRHVQFGLLIQGAAYELRFPRQPDLSLYDGYLTIDAGQGHLHVCIGDHRGEPGHPVASRLAARRRCHHAELYRVWVEGTPVSWGFRMFNGDDHQQLTVLLPNPFLSDDGNYLPQPDFGRLACWDELRATFLGLAPDDADRSGARFLHP